MKIFSLLCLTISQVVLSNVIGIDYGTDWLKVTLLTPGGGLDTVLNRESKRKTNAVITIRKGTRTFGIEAETLSMRFPQWSYSQLKNLLGKPYTSHARSEFEKQNPSSNLIQTLRGTIGFQHDPETSFQVEELVAMLLTHCRQQAEVYKGIVVSGAVVTVPPGFGVFERRAVMDAGEIAGLKILALINDPTAVAINYAVGKSFTTPEFHLFYDMGAGSTVATVIEFKSGKTKRHQEIIVRGSSSDDTLGGRQVDIRLRDFLAEKFTAKNKGQLKGKVFDDVRAMARLQKEANRVKTILSANTQTFAGVENLFFGLDFKIEVTRAQVEDLCGDLFERAIKPIETVLGLANVTLDKIKTLVLFGGGVRIPAIQSLLSDYVGSGKVARNIDGDEAAAFGAVLHGAAVSAAFRLGMTTTVKDLGGPRGVWVSYVDETGKPVEVEVVGAYGFLGSKKMVRFGRTTDFEFKVWYSGNERVVIAAVKIAGLTAALGEHKEAMNDIPVVKVQVDLNESGLVLLSSPTLYLQLLLEKAQAIDKNEKEQGTVKNEAVKDEDERDVDEESKDSKDSNNSKEKKDEKKENESSGRNKIKTKKVKLKMDIDWQTIPPLSEVDKKTMRERLEAFDAQDRERREREAALNALETFIYKCKELGFDDDISDLATAAEQAALEKAVAAASEWYDDNSDKALRKDFIQEKNKLFKLGGPIFKRRREVSVRPSAIEDFLKNVKLATTMHTVVSNVLNDTNVSEKELYQFFTLIENDTEWFKTTSEAQKALKNNVDPVLLVADLESRGKILAQETAKLSLEKRLKPKPKVKKEEKVAAFDPQELMELSKKMQDPKTTKEEMLNSVQDIIRLLKKTKLPESKLREILVEAMAKIPPEKGITEEEKKEFLEQALTKIKSKDDDDKDAANQQESEPAEKESKSEDPKKAPESNQQDPTDGEL